MASNVTIVSSLEITANPIISIDDFRSRVIANGVALLFAYIVNYVFQAYTTFARGDQGKAQVLKKLLETSQVMYWFGIATIFSIFPPFYAGGFNAVMSYLTLIVLIINHIFCLKEGRVKGKSAWGITYFIYYLLIVIWIIVGLILAYSWSNKIYTTS